MVCCSIQTRARSTDVVGCRRDELMSCITRCWDLISTLCVAGNSVLCVIVRIFVRHRRGGYVVGVEGASSCSTWLVTARLLSAYSCFAEER